MTGAEVETLQPGLPAEVDGTPAARAAEALAARSATVYEAFVMAAEAHPDAAFLCIPARPGRAYCPDGTEFTYGQVRAEVDSRAALYRAAGYGPGHRVALMLDNRPEHLFNQLALYAVGATQIPVNPDYLDHELEYLLSHSAAVLALGHEGHMEQLSRVAGKLGTLVLDEAALDRLPAVTGAGRERPSRATEAALIYTSGTTGRPKGCVIDHEYHFAVGLGYARHGGRLALRHEGDRLFVPLPVFHVNAGINTLTALILTGNCLILPDRFHPDSWWQDIAATRATAMHYLGIIPPILMKRPPGPEDRGHGLRFGLGAGLDPDLHAAFEERFGVPMVEVWGMTETGRFLADCHEPRRIWTRAFGKPYDDLEAQVWDEEGREVPYGTEGELVVRAPGDDARRGFFREYLKNPEATAEVWQGGWFHTGDVVTQEPDGMLHFVERRKNIIRRSGENISAAEVENALVGHEAVAAVAVISVTDEMRDEEVMACIIPAEGAARDEATARAVFEHGRRLVAYYKLPGWVAFVDDLPRTGTQKVRKGLIFPGLDDPRDAQGIIDLRALKKRSKP
ncbi:AMP-binding protein [Cribrihabitans sp. XS_ASV171]